MDGKGCWVDNVFLKRLWRSLKYECVHLNAFETGLALRAGLGQWINHYNTQRPHSAFAGQTPDESYYQGDLSPDAGRVPAAVSELKMAA
jgi:putative transposase